MGLKAWFTRNVADTDAGTHADLRPLDWPVAPADALGRLAAVVGGLRGWQVERADPMTNILAATRRTRVFGFVDDVTVRLEPEGTGVRVHVRSAARVGVGDLGQNRRNVLALFRAPRCAVGQT